MEKIIADRIQDLTWELFETRRVFVSMNENLVEIIKVLKKKKGKK